LHLVVGRTPESWRSSASRARLLNLSHRLRDLKELVEGLRGLAQAYEEVGDVAARADRIRQGDDLRLREKLAYPQRSKASRLVSVETDVELGDTGELSRPLAFEHPRSAGRRNCGEALRLQDEPVELALANNEL